MGENVDYDEEGRKLQKKLAAELISKLGGGGGMFDPLNAIYVDSETKGKVFVGNQTVASSLEMLRKFVRTSHPFH